MYSLESTKAQSQRLGQRGDNPLGVEFYQQFNLTNDRDLWTRPDGQLWSPDHILGGEPGDFEETRTAMAAKGFWPLYQDAHIHQYVLEFKRLMRWVCLEAHDRKYGGQPNRGRKLVIRDPARNNDERTCIAALLPEESCFGHTLNGVRVDDALRIPLLAIINSISFDYQMRKRVGGQHVSPYLLELAAMPSIQAAAAVITELPEVHANQQQTWVYDDPDQWELLWSIEHAVAKLYGLQPDDYTLMLQDFPGFARKRAAFFAYLQERIAEWREETK
jgi:hypothetical protein